MKQKQLKVGFMQFVYYHFHTVYPETTNATDNNKRSRNQQAGKAVNTCQGTTCHGSNMIRGKLFPDRYLLHITAY